MTRYLLDTGIAGLYLDRKRGVFERAEAEVARGNRVGIAAPVLAELAFRAEGSPPAGAELAKASSSDSGLEALARGCGGHLRVRPHRLRAEETWPTHRPK